MQIRNDYGYNFNSNSSSDLPSHTHHITECLHEDEPKKQEGGVAGMKQEKTAEQISQYGDRVEFTGLYTGQSTKEASSDRKGLGLVKELWESLGDDETSSKVSGLSLGADADRKGALNGIYGAMTGLRQSVFHKLAYRWENTRERLKTGISAALKRFGRGKDAFGTLTDAKNRSNMGKQSGDQEKLPDREMGVNGRKPEITAAPGSDNHLLDSYTKTGEYCKLGDTFKS